MTHYTDMTHYTNDNTIGYTSSELAILNDVYITLSQCVNDDFEQDTHAVSDSVLNAFICGDTADTLAARVRAQHPTLFEG
jgi:uncharacterized protein with HEPN domain